MTGALRISPCRASAKQMLPIRSGKDIARVHGLACELGSWIAFSRSDIECLSTAAAQIATLIRKSSKPGAMTVEFVVKDGTPGISLVASFGEDHAEELSRSFDGFDHSVSNGNVFILTKFARRDVNSRAVAA